MTSGEEIGMGVRVKITPRIGVQVARRLRLAAGVRSLSMSAVVNDVLDHALPSLEEITAQITGLVMGEGGGDDGGR